VKKLLKDNSRHFEGSPYTSPVNDFPMAPNTPSFEAGGVSCEAGDVCCEAGDVCWAMPGTPVQSTLAPSTREAKRRTLFVRIAFFLRPDVDHIGIDVHKK
jgi:hypothetical protein